MWRHPWYLPAAVLGMSVSLIACESGEQVEGENDEEIVSEQTQQNIDENDKTTRTGEEIVEDETIEGETKEHEPEPAYTINEADWSLEPIEDAPEDVVLITIDDAPDTYAVEMAEILHERDVRAIFFVNGHFINDEEGKEQLQEIVELGHTIGNHTMTHANLSEISDEEQEEEIVQLNDEIEHIIGERPEFFRAPFGANTETSWKILGEEGMVGMNWSYGYDWEPEYTEATELAEIMVETEFLREGANILMHDREWTYEALDDIITGLSEKGYSFIDPLEIARSHENDIE